MKSWIRHKKGLEYLTLTFTPSVNITTCRKIVNSHLGSRRLKHGDEKNYLMRPFYFTDDET